jgi:type IV secretory pathway VirB10-like protein
MGVFGKVKRKESSSPMHTPDQLSSTAGDHASHFSAVEALFFKEGEEKAADPVEVDNFDDLAGATAARHSVAKPRRMTTAAISVACVGILAGAILWRVETRKGVSAQVATPVATAAVQAVAPAPAPAAPLPPAPETAPAVVAPPAPAPTAAVPLPPAPETVPAAAAAEPPASLPSAVEPAAPAVAALPPTAAASEGDDLRAACKRAVQQHRAKDVLATCGQAFAATPRSADIAVILARTEFDRGRANQAVTWARKAVAIDPDASDAYVFIGNAEQNAGHSQAARAAYQHYLQLAPMGRYAADLRAVLKSL